MPFDTFISYSSKDKIAADTACGVLEGAGVRCWIAPRDIRPGGEYGAAIIDAIDQCRVMVLIFSSSANASGQIHREIERAVAKGVAIVPVRIEEIAPTKSMEYFLGAIHWLDALTPPIEKHLQHLAETVKAILQVDTSTHSALLGESSSRNAAATQSPGQEADRPGPHLETTRTLGGTDSLISKKTARTRWLLPALSAVICVLLLAGGVWLYQNRVQSPAPLPDTLQPPPKQAEVLVPETVPFISDSERAVIRSTYQSAPDHKALALSTRSNFCLHGRTAATAAGALACSRSFHRKAAGR
jgi:hypothetical protein